jgi:hypothetical protein
MRKFSLILVIFVLAAPAWAVVTISVEPNTPGNSFNIVYDVNEGEKVRAFALDIYVDDDINIVDVNDFHVGESDSDNPGYGIFPSNFAQHIDPGGDPIDWDSEDYIPLGNEEDYPDDTLEGLDTNGITVELGSLYVGDNNDPCDSGTLLRIILDANFPEVNHIGLELNQIRGGVVLEDPNDPVVVKLVGWNRCLDGGIADWPPGSGSEYGDWVNYGRPSCWCYARQCRGDANNGIQGIFWVYTQDLQILKDAYARPDTFLPEGGICADFNHRPQAVFRVYTQDLAVLKGYYARPPSMVPICDQAPVNTGPYYFWAE